MIKRSAANGPKNSKKQAQSYTTEHSVTGRESRVYFHSNKLNQYKSKKRTIYLCYANEEEPRERGSGRLSREGRPEANSRINEQQQMCKQGALGSFPWIRAN